MSTRRTVVAIRLWSDTLGAVVRRAGGVVPVASFGDTNEAREWLVAHPEVDVAVVARVDESEVWALNALLTVVRGREDRAPVVVLSPHPRAALPVLLTDFPGLTVADPTDGHAFATALDAVLSEDPNLVRARA